MSLEPDVRPSGYFVPASEPTLPACDDALIRYGTPLQIPEYPSDGETIFDLLRKVLANFGATNMLRVDKPPNFATPFSWNRVISYSLDNLVVEDKGDACLYIFPPGAKDALGGLFDFIDSKLLPGSAIGTFSMRFTYQPQRGEDDYPFSLVSLKGKLILTVATSAYSADNQQIEYSELKLSPDPVPEGEPSVLRASIGSEPAKFIQYRAKSENVALKLTGKIRSLVTDLDRDATTMLHDAYMDGTLDSYFPGLFPAGLHYCAQGTMYHSERHWLFENGERGRSVDSALGASVWEHSLCVRDQVAEQLNSFLKTPLVTQKFPIWGVLIEQCQDVFLWAALLHDIGKLKTGRALVSGNVSYPGSNDQYDVTLKPFPGHEKRGVEILNNSDISPLFEDTTWEDLRHIKKALLLHLIRHHGDTHDSIPNDIDLLRLGTATPEDKKRIDAYITPKNPVFHLALTIFHHCDRLAIVRADGDVPPNNEALLREAYVLLGGDDWRGFEKGSGGSGVSK